MISTILNAILKLQRFLITLTACFASLALAGGDQQSRPNLLVVMVDDMGFTDLGSFGGEINTPNLDALAFAGVRFTNFHAAPTCSPTRAMLLTGVDNHRAGLGNMAEEMAPNQRDVPGYEGYLNQNVVTVASLLRDAGYHTYMAGKWHLGLNPETSPAARGFERSFAMLAGGASHFSDMKPAYAPTPDAKAPYRRDFDMLEELPDNFQYSSQFYVDELINYIERDRDSGRPFFAYLAFTAPHWPIQAPTETIARYKGKYDSGYDQLFQRRLQKQINLGLLPQGVQGAERPPEGRPWHSLSAEERRLESRKMEVYAAMIDEVDVHTGRLIEYLKSRKLFDNTVVLFLSDNGAEGHGLDETWPADTYPDIRKVIDETHDFSFENIGKPNSYSLLGPNWAWASSPALRGSKGFTSEGGTRVAAFAYYPQRFESGEISNAPVSVRDIVPTLLDISRVEHPGDSYKGRSVYEPSGMSLVGLLEDGVSTPDLKSRVQGIELMGKRSILAGDWKLLHMPKPAGSGDWQLYNLREDLAERSDQATQNPQKVQELLQHWQRYSTENRVVLPNWTSGY